MSVSTGRGPPASKSTTSGRVKSIVTRPMPAASSASIATDTISRAAATHFRQQQSGAYVHMSSTSGLIGNFGQANYSAAKLGIAYGFDMVRHLVDLVGPAHAHMILMTGERFDAAEAARVGLINKVVAADALAGDA